MGREQRVAAARRWQDERVVLEDPETAYIEDGVSIGPGTVIGPSTVTAPVTGSMRRS